MHMDTTTSQVSSKYDEKQKSFINNPFNRRVVRSGAVEFGPIHRIYKALFLRLISFIDKYLMKVTNTNQFSKKILILIIFMSLYCL